MNKNKRATAIVALFLRLYSIPMDELINKKPEFKSYFWGGFECAYPRIANRKRIDLLKATRHDEYCREDYKMLKDLGIYTVREGLSWSQIDRGGNSFDFSRFEKMMRIGKEEGMQQVWDLNHFDYPDYIDPFTARFPKKYAWYAKQCIKVLRKYQAEGTLYIVPMNEISFFAFMAGHIGVWEPYTKQKGFLFKQQLVRATIAAIDAIRDIDTNVRFIHVDPVIHRKPKEPSTLLTKALAEMFNTQIKYEAWDMLAGYLKPELGGGPEYLDLIGCNYYYNNQEWIIQREDHDDPMYQGITWKHPDRISIVDILDEVRKRYNRPIIVTETGAHGQLRSGWWTRLFSELKDSPSRNIQLLGLCAYPIIDRPDWDTNHLTNSGFWDFKNNDPGYRRIPHESTIATVRQYIKRLNTTGLRGLLEN